MAGAAMMAGVYHFSAYRTKMTVLPCYMTVFTHQDDSTHIVSQERAANAIIVLIGNMMCHLIDALFHPINYLLRAIGSGTFRKLAPYLAYTAVVDRPGFALAGVGGVLDTSGGER